MDAARPRARREVGREAWIYANLLAHVGIAPEWYGVFGAASGEGEVVLALMAYAGEAVTDAMGLPLNVK